MLLADRIPLAHVVTGLPAASKSEVIDHLVGLLAGHGAVIDPARLGADVKVREETMSTGVGEGLALPHARTPAVTGTVVALATLAAPVEWDALDGAPVDVVLLMAGPESARGAHIRLLAHLSVVFSTPGVRERMAEAGTAEALMDEVARAERIA